MECERTIKGQFDRVRAMNVAELGVGFNPRVTRAIGYVLKDERGAGMVHVDFELNRSRGVTSSSALHWDFVSAPGVNAEVEKLVGSAQEFALAVLSEAETVWRIIA
jgi:leucyl aminopeptidase (aminopeptidase T)